MTARDDIEAVAAELRHGHWSYEPTKDYDGWLCDCGERIAGRNVEDLDAAMQAHVATVLAEALAPMVAGVRAGALREGASLGRRATLDPGAFVKRGPDNDGNAYGEYLDRWQQRAADEAIARAEAVAEQGGGSQ